MASEHDCRKSINMNRLDFYAGKRYAYNGKMSYKLVESQFSYWKAEAAVNLNQALRALFFKEIQNTRSWNLVTDQSRQDEFCVALTTQKCNSFFNGLVTCGFVSVVV